MMTIVSWELHYAALKDTKQASNNQECTQIMYHIVV